MSNTIKFSSLQHKTRDLSTAMHTVREQSGRFISRFKTGPRATNHKHEWLEDQIKGRSFTVTAYSASAGATLSAADLLKVAVGTRFRVAGTPVIFVVSEITGGKIKATVHAANGNTTKTALAADDVCQIISTPVKEASSNGDGESIGRKVGTNYNYTQIFRKEIEISRTASQSMTYDQVENNMARQTEFAMIEVNRDLNRAAIWGVRTEANEAAGVKGEMGGLYAFCNLNIDAASGRLTSTLVNDAVGKIIAEGGNPTAIYCSPGQARVLGAEYKNKITVLRDDKTRGVYVATVVNEYNGQSLDIVADVDFDDADVFVADDSGFAVSEMQPIGDRDTTSKDFDGEQRLVLGEMTLEFHNAAQRLCRIKNLKAPADALAEIAAEAKEVAITATSMAITADTVTVAQQPAG